MTPPVTEDQAVHELALLMGITPHYFDVWGGRHEVSIETKKAILKAMGLPVENGQAMANELEKRLLPPVLEPSFVGREGEGIEVPVILSWGGVKADFSVIIEDEKKKKQRMSICLSPRQAIETPRGKFDKYILPLAPLKEGYYWLSVSVRFRGTMVRARSFLIITPGECYLPSGYDRTWGMTLALHQIRSRRNWGIGDFRDLGDIVDWIAGLGGDFIGILPLHDTALPGRISPYSPISRLYRNFLYLDLEGVPEFAAAARSIGKETIRAEAALYRRSKYVNYRKVHALKLRVLKEMFSLFYRRHYIPRTRRGRALLAFEKREGQPLADYAAFKAASEAHGPGPLFHVYIQWLIEEQLGSLARRAEAGGMRAGLYFDLAVGVMGGGADEWCFKDSLAAGATAGAPPDDFSRMGQNWGISPFLPEKIRENGFAPFINTIRKNLEHAGMLRIDHAMGLFRLFWIPEGMKPVEGAYVRYPTPEMMAILEIESRRKKAVIVSEDLGTVEAGVREALMGAGMLSYRLFYYERLYPSTELVPPALYPPRAFCAVSTHDLPTLCGFWAGKDMEIRRRLSLYPSEKALTEDFSARSRDKEIIVAALKNEGLLPDNYTVPGLMDEDLMYAIYRHLGRAPCIFAAASLDDWLRSEEQPNMPGTTDAYPNWRIKAGALLESFTSDGGGKQSPAAAFMAEGRGRR